MIVGARKSNTLNVVPPAFRVSTADDYDTGSWTPELSTSAGDPLTGNFTGTYTRIGNLVTVAMYYDINSVTGISGSVSTTLPYQAGFSGGATFMMLPIVYSSMDPTNNNATARTAHNGLFFRVGQNDTTSVVINFRNHDTAASLGGGVGTFQTLQATSTVFSTSSFMYCTGTYVTNGTKLV